MLLKKGDGKVYGWERGENGRNKEWRCNDGKLQECVFLKKGGASWMSRDDNMGGDRLKRYDTKENVW